MRHFFDTGSGVALFNKQVQCCSQQLTRARVFAARAARLFHATLAAALVEWVAQAAQRRGVTTVAAAGGCLLNRLLAQALAEGLAARGLRFILPRDLPPNDGGLALGQAWVALYAATNGSTVALCARSKK